MDALQVMYFPQETPPAVGPTEVLPGSHFMPVASRHIAAAGGIVPPSKSGSILITHYSIMHRRGDSSTSAPCIRNMLKYVYFRQTPPEKKDWPHEAGFDFHNRNWGTHYLYYPNGTQNSIGGAKMAVEMFLWLCNRPMPPLKGGQGWLGAQNRGNMPKFIATQYGVPSELADWPACLDDESGGGVGARSGPDPLDNIYWSQPGGANSAATTAVGALQDEVVDLRGELAAVRRDLQAILAKL